MKIQIPRKMYYEKSLFFVETTGQTIRIFIYLGFSVFYHVQSIYDSKNHSAGQKFDQKSG